MINPPYLYITLRYTILTYSYIIMSSKKRPEKNFEARNHFWIQINVTVRDT